MRKRGWIVVGFALAVAGCGGGGTSGNVAARSASGTTQTDEGGAMGRNYYGAIGLAANPGARASGNAIYGDDISYYQGTVDFGKVQTQSSFVVMRASYGKSSVDTKFATYRAAAEAQGLAIGFYHYSYPQLNAAVDEANHFANVVGTLKTGQFVVLDFEESYSGDVVGWCKTWLDTVYARLGVRPLIYLNLSLARGYAWSPVINANYGLWLAYYDYNKTAAAPSTPWPFVAMRQYSDRETVPGISGGTDGDVFYGDLWSLFRYGKSPSGIAIGPGGPDFPAG